MRRFVGEFHKTKPFGNKYPSVFVIPVKTSKSVVIDLGDKADDINSDTSSDDTDKNGDEGGGGDSRSQVHKQREGNGTSWGSHAKSDNASNSKSKSNKSDSKGKSRRADDEAQPKDSDSTIAAADNQGTEQPKVLIDLNGSALDEDDTLD